MYAAVSSVGCALWPKLITLVGPGGVWMQGGGPGGGRHEVRGRDLRLGCERAATATWVGGRWWLTELGCFGGVGVLGFITCPIWVRLLYSHVITAPGTVICTIYRSI